MYEPLFDNFPDDHVQRWQIMCEFIGNWFTEVHPADGYSEVELDSFRELLNDSVPDFLQAWLAHSGHRNDMWAHVGGNGNCFEQLNRFDEWAVFCDLEDRAGPAFRVPIESDDPQLYQYSNNGTTAEPCKAKLSDYALHMLIQSIWFGCGPERIPYFTKGIQLSHDQLQLHADGSVDHEEIVGRQVRPGCRHHHWFTEFHGMDLLVDFAYPDTLLVASRTNDALQQLPRSTQDLLMASSDVLADYDFYRTEGA